MVPFARLRFPLYFDGEPAAGAGGGAPAGTPASGGASPGASGTPSPSAAPAGGGGTGQPGAGGAPAGTPAAQPTQYTYPEDRSRYIPPHRYNEVAGRLREQETLVARYKAMIEAGTGVKVPGAEPRQPPEVVEARNLILEHLLPELKPLLKLAPEQIDKILKTVEQFPQFAESFQQSTQQHWDGRGAQAINYITAAVAKDMNVDKLTPFQSVTVGNTFITWLQMQDGRMDRYGQNDQSLFDEFLTEYRSGFFDPIRRIGQAPGARVVQQNQRLPAAPRGGGVVPAAPPVQGKTEDEVHDAAWASFAAATRR